MPRTVRALRSILDGAGAAKDGTARLPVTTARSLRLSTPHRPLDIRIDALTHVQFAARAGVRAGEELVTQLILGPRSSPQYVPASTPASVIQPVWKTLWSGDGGRLASDDRAALKAKIGSFAYRTVLRIGAAADTPERRERLILDAFGALRTAEGPSVHLRLASEKPAAIDAVALPRHWPLRLSIAELTGLMGLPVGDGELPGMPPRHPALLAPDRLAREDDRIVAKATAPNVRGGLLGYSAKDATRHTWVTGPSGTGKTVLATELARQAADAGQGLVYIEPKDGVTELLARIPQHRQADVVLLDPSDGTAVIGLNPLHTAGSTPELIADSLVSLMKSVYASAWGVRIHDIVSQAILTLARRPGSTLVELPLLLTDAAFRRSITKDAMASDPLGTGSFWASYEQLSEDARAQAIAPVMTRLRQWLTMPSLQATLGQSQPRITIRQAIAEKKLLLVPLQPGKLGKETSALISALVLHEVWVAMQERIAIPEAERTPISIVIDEVGSFLHTTTDLGEMAVLMRSLGGALTLLHQHLRQLGPDLLAALDANAASRVVFQLRAADAAALAKGDPQLTAEDFMKLPPYGVYVRLAHDNHVPGWTSGVTLPPHRPTSDADAIRQLSRQQYGRPVAEVVTEIRERVSGGTDRRASAPYGRQERVS